MKRPRLARDENGSSVIEFAIVAPPLLLLITGVAQVAIWLWIGFSLQHGAELAARCATYNPTNCANATSITTYAASKVYGLTVAPAAFVYTQATCGNQVTASLATANFLASIGAPAMTASAQACFPK